MDAAILAIEMPGMDVHIHQHAGFQIVYAFEKKFSTEVSGQSYINVKGFAIRPQLPHACSGVSGRFAIINIEPDSIAGRVLDKSLAEKDIQELHTSDDVYTFLSLPHAEGEAIYAALAYLRSIQSANKLSARVQQVIDIIRRQNTEDTTLASLAAAVHLSQSRLSALFKQQTGSSLSKFILWTRLRRAIHLLLTEDRSLSEIAAETGFYDSPNFTKYMHKMIGVPPVAFRKKSDLIQVI
jgi:AraC-like DNA-binding protein